LHQVCIISFVIGTVSLLFAGDGVVAALHEARVIKTEAAARSAAYGNEFQSRVATNQWFIAVAAGFVVSAILLLVGARSLHRQKTAGVAWLWAYVLVQLLVAAALSSTMMWAIYHSPGGMLFYIGLIPGAIAAIYPLVLAVLLARASSVESQ
jgi:hypothetical protein